jgi:alpha-tubulin suppressor-like RCC1 family protein
LFTWGYGKFGQLGDNSTGASANKSSPVLAGVSAGTGENVFPGGISPVQIGSSLWTAVGTGIQHSAAIRSGGTLFTWGRNNQGQLGDGTTTNRSSPVQIGSSSWTAVSTGGSHTAGIK